MKRYLQLTSFSGGGQKYQIDLLDRTCTCTAFSKDKDCKHLTQLGLYRTDKVWMPSSHPTFSQALSGLVKTIRLRRVEEAVRWMLYCDAMPQSGGRFRIARRILIGAAEDGHSIAVMERTSKNFSHLCKEDTHLIELAAEIVRVCSVRNWWDASSGGQGYIYSGMVANRLAYLYQMGGETHEKALEVLEDGIQQQDAIMSLTALERLMLFRKISRTELANYLLKLSETYDNSYAARLCTIHLQNKSALSRDANFLCQSVYLLAGGEISVLDEIKPVMASEVRKILVEQFEEMKKYAPINPAWCDGIHCAGVDRRFAGMWNDMNAVCMAFNHYGRVDPNDKWLRKFYVMDGLDIDELGTEELPEE